MEILIASRRSKKAAVSDSPDLVVVDLTSKAEQPWVRFSPFYPHGDIPVPLAPGWVSQSVEGIWQGLKVFEREDLDRGKFAVATMRDIKRAVGERRGRVVGHRAVESGELLSYLDARRAIYLPAYRWVLENRLQAEVAALRESGQGRTLRFLDYETNCDLRNTAAPLSHAWLVACYLREEWPG